MTDIVAMGEMMIRLMPPGNLRFEQASNFDVFYGGDESIVATSLARLGMNAYYVSALPDNVFGDIAIRKLWEQGVKTDYILREPGRIGLNFYENGASVRPSQVIYDRVDSVISKTTPGKFNFDTIFKGRDWFHTSGITPALSDGMYEVTKEALKKAKEYGLTTSVDLNYRRKLWPPEKAKKCMTSLMEHVDVLIGNEEDAEIMLGYSPGKTDVTTGMIDEEGYRDIFIKMKKDFRFKIIASTLRESRSASDNGWSVLVYDGENFHRSKTYDIHLVDRGGGGASFSAGLIYGLCKGMEIGETAEYAAGFSALKQTVVGDFNLITDQEVRNMIMGDVSGRVKR